MTFEDVENTLPQGFHDASIESLSFNFSERKLRLAFDLLVKYDEASTKTVLRFGEVIAKGVSLFAVYPCSTSTTQIKPHRGDKSSLTVFKFKKGLPDSCKVNKSALNDAGTTATFFIGDGNDFFDMAVSYQTTEFRWINEERTI